MPLPIGAGNNAVFNPSVWSRNTAQAPERAARHSSAKTVTSDQINDRQLAIFMAADYMNMGDSDVELRRLPHMSVSHSSPFSRMFMSALAEGNPEGKTLQDLTLMLKSSFRHANAHETTTVVFGTDHGQVTMSSGFWGRIRTCSRATNNYKEFKKEKFPGFTDALTLSVMRVLYKPITIDNFLSGRFVVIDIKDA